MSDLVYKLRNLGSDLPWEVLDIGWDASEEIERLRALLTEKTKQEAKAHDYWVRLSAENVRLREALEKIAIHDLQAIAIDALTPGERTRAALAEQEKTSG